MRIAVIDGQGGGIGRTLVEKLRQTYGAEVTIVALGTNAMATALMLRAGADEGASGENAICHNADQVDVILGPMGILCANALMGELTPAMARAIGESRARKILVPVSRCRVFVAGLGSMTIPQYIEDAVALVTKV